MKTMRIGLLGASKVATYAVIAPAREIEGVKVTAVAARDFRRASAYAVTHGIERVLPSYSALFADPDIDLIYVGSPPRVHAEQAIAAIKCGKPVLVEKPFAFSAAEARSVETIARQANVPVFEAMHSPHHRLFLRILEIVDSGVLGRLCTIDAMFETPVKAEDPIRWRRDLGGGALMDLGVYPLAWVRRIAGEEFKVDSASAEMVSEVDASFVANLIFPDGLVARIASSMVAPKMNAQLHIEGTGGSLTVTNPLAPQNGHEIVLETRGEIYRETVVGPSTYAAQLAAVRATILEGADFLHEPGDFVHSMVAVERIRDAMGAA